MPRVSISRLMALVVACAVGLAALRDANELWAGIILLVALGLFGAAALGILYLRGADRARWLGFALFEGGYLLLAFGPWFAEQAGPKLGTSQVLAYVHDRVTDSPAPASSRLQDLIEEQASLTARLATYRRRVRNFSSDPSVMFTANKLSRVTQQISVIQGSSPTTAPPAPGNRWRSLLPGAANFDPFLRTGHGLFAILAGLIGGAVAVAFRARREVGS